MKFGEIFNSDLNHQINTLNIGLDKVEDKVRIDKKTLDEREENLRKKLRAKEEEQKHKWEIQKRCLDERQESLKI